MATPRRFACLSACCELVVGSLAVACHQPVAAVFVPSLEVRCSAATVAQPSELRAADTHRDVHAMVYFAFRPQSLRTPLFSAADRFPELAFAPCDDDDAICIEESQILDAESLRALAELP